MKVIVGLGNPGAQYEGTRHNAGFMALDALAHSHAVKFRKHPAYLAGTIQVENETVALLKPMIFMNQSGEAVRLYLEEHADVSVNDLLVVVDDINLPLGRMRFRPGGSAGGQHGLESVIECLKTNQFSRLRIGIAGEKVPTGDLTDYLLGSFRKSEMKLLRAVIDRAQNACLDWVIHGSKHVMNQYNPAP